MGKHHIILFYNVKTTIWGVKKSKIGIGLGV
jgi:hypothetical protein